MKLFLFSEHLSPIDVRGTAVRGHVEAQVSRGCVTASTMSDPSLFRGGGFLSAGISSALAFYSRFISNSHLFFRNPISFDRWLALDAYSTIQHACTRGCASSETSVVLTMYRRVESGRISCQFRLQPSSMGLVRRGRASVKNHPSVADLVIWYTTK